DPVTLHKYLYANADPVVYTDPTGNFSMGQLMSTINTVGILATRAQSAYTFYQLATGEISAKQAGFEILAGMAGGKLIKMFSRRGRFRNCSVGNSFVEGTLISTPEGLVPIELIQIGDLVYSYDEKTGETVEQEVVHLISGVKEHEIVSLSINGETIDATDGHPFYVSANTKTFKWLQAKNINSEVSVLSLSGDIYPIADLTSDKSIAVVYNLTVDNTHTYYVGESEVLAHNSTCRIPHRATPRIEAGRQRPNSNRGEGWAHIRWRHLRRPGAAPGSQGDLFADGTTGAQILEAAKKLVASGKRISDPSRAIQTFEKRMVVNGMRARYRVSVDSDDGNRVITIFPVITGQ
ncbi:MAG: polymorphic toxin-type HINT domain-containing protein, partial [Kangiellaceae bacterium]|nr:polymorphic toxin-type HINT domain-containing protein [Kangiellaceae bacterium]